VVPFSDDELEAFYREIEARTAYRELMENRRAERSARRAELPDCPTPDKLPFTSPAAAMDGIERIKARTFGTVSLRYYECACGRWHITSSAQLTHRPIAPVRRRKGKKKR